MNVHETKLKLAQFTKELYEFRGKYGRKGKRGGSSKTPTSAPTAGYSKRRPSIDEEDYPDYNKWSASDLSKELKKYAKANGWKSSLKGEGEGEWESKHIKAGGKNGKMGATYFYTIETMPAGKDYGNREAGLMGKFFFRERDENGDFDITLMDEHVVNLSDYEGDSAFPDSIDEIQQMFEKAKDSW